MVRETRLSVDNLVAPLFVIEGMGRKESLDAMPGQYRWSVDMLVEEVSVLVSLGIPAVALFPAIDDNLKTTDAREGMNPDGLFPRALRTLKSEFPELVLISDVALDPYSSDGHDGIVREGKIANDESLNILASMAVVHANAGADIVAPSDMMDGRVGAIRGSLDEAGFEDVCILSYTAKYASSFYGPFREALDSAPRHLDGVPADKKTYQMDPANVEEAMKEARLAISEGADMIMVKPGLPYLDVLRVFNDIFPETPRAVYNVSGEYAMVKAAAARGWVEERKVVPELLGGFRRAGASIIFTYHARDMAQWLSER